MSGERPSRRPSRRTPNTAREAPAVGPTKNKPEKADVVARATKLMADAREKHPDWPLRDAKKKN